jgi:hypothetical protein
MVFLNFCAGRVVKTTLAPKFGSLIQKCGRVGLGESGATTKSRAPAPPTCGEGPWGTATHGAWQAVRRLRPRRAE